MIGDVGMHRSDDTDVIDTRSDVRKNIADFDPRFSILLKPERRHQQTTGLTFGFQICRFGGR